MLQRELIRRIDVGGRREPPTHPNAAGLVVAHILRYWATTRSLAVLTKKNLIVSTAYRAKIRRLAPIPGFLPAELRKPRETLLDVRDVKYRRQTLKFHVVDLLSFPFG